MTAEDVLKQSLNNNRFFGSIEAFRNEPLWVSAIQAMEEYANKFRTKLTDEELEAEAEREYPSCPDTRAFLPVFGYHDMYQAERAAHIKARKMGSSNWVSVEDRLPEIYIDEFIEKLSRYYTDDAPFGYIKNDLQNTLKSEK
jgi:hypothetical protein